MTMLVAAMVFFIWGFISGRWLYVPNDAAFKPPPWLDAITTTFAVLVMTALVMNTVALLLAAIGGLVWR